MRSFAGLSRGPDPVPRSFRKGGFLSLLAITPCQPMMSVLTRQHLPNPPRRWLGGMAGSADLFSERCVTRWISAGVPSGCSFCGGPSVISIRLRRLECLTGLPCTVLLGSQGFALVFRGFSERVCILPLSVGSQSGFGKLRGKDAPVCPLPGPAVMRSSDRDRLRRMITPILRIGHPSAGSGLPTGRDDRDGFTAAVGGRRQGSWESPADPSIRARLRLPRLYQDEEPRFAAGKAGKDGYSGCLR